MSYVPQASLKWVRNKLTMSFLTTPLRQFQLFTNQLPFNNNFVPTSAPTLETNSWNKYTQIASRALRQALGETDRVAAERRAQIGV